MKIHQMSELCLQLGFCCKILYLLWNLDHLVVGGPLDHLLEDGRVHVGQRHQLLLILVHPEVLKGIFDENVCK